jgi:hypothetical protein
MIGAYLLLLLIVLMVMFLVCGGTYVAVVQQVAAATVVATSYAEVQVVVLRVWLCVLIYSLLPSHRMNRCMSV